MQLRRTHNAVNRQLRLTVCCSRGRLNPPLRFMYCLYLRCVLILAAPRSLPLTFESFVVVKDTGIPIAAIISSSDIPGVMTLVCFCGERGVSQRGISQRGVSQRMHVHMHMCSGLVAAAVTSCVAFDLALASLASFAAADRSPKGTASRLRALALASV